MIPVKKFSSCTAWCEIGMKTRGVAQLCSAVTPTRGLAQLCAAVTSSCTGWTVLFCFRPRLHHEASFFNSRRTAYFDQAPPCLLRSSLSFLGSVRHYAITWPSILQNLHFIYGHSSLMCCLHPQIQQPSFELLRRIVCSLHWGLILQLVFSLIRQFFSCAQSTLPCLLCWSPALAFGP